MVLGHSHRRHSIGSNRSNRSSTDEVREKTDGVTQDDETIVDAEQGSMLMHIISQLRPGADLSRVTFPTFILEPRSMLERITNFMAHPETLLPMPAIDDPVERFVAVVKFYLSGWHIKPPGVKKPLNPILGETFTCYWDYEDGTRGYYISEQTSHHPPKSSYFFLAPEHNIRIDGTLKPRSRFLGNSAASLMEGIAVMRFTNRNERYFVTQPNMYARGILFGKMKYELGDHSFVRCPETGLVADIEFKTKGYFSGTYNSIGGFIKEANTGKELFELSGLWTGEMYIKDLTTGKKDLLFDASHAKETPPSARPISEQEERESQRLWEKVNNAIKTKDQDVATDEKTRIEDRQRQEAAKRAEEGVEWHPKLFRAVKGGPGGPEEEEQDLDWIIDAKIDGTTPEEQVAQVLEIAAILPGQKPSKPKVDTTQVKKTEEAPINNTEEAPVIPQKQHEDAVAATQRQIENAPAVTQKQNLAPLKPVEEDLIDFGQHDSPHEPNANHELPKQGSTTNNGTSTGPASSTKPHARPRGAVVRTDSETRDVEEFVDAES